MTEEEDKEMMYMTTCQCIDCLKDGPHRSDCSVHNEPAMRRGSCDCGQEEGV